MFLRRNRKRIDGETTEFWTLCESVRTERRPRQRVVATPGKLDDDDLRAGWLQIKTLLDGRPPGPRPPGHPQRDPEVQPPPGTWEPADLSRIEVGHVREFGSVFLGMAPRRALEMSMRGKGLVTGVRMRVEAVGTIRSMDVSVPVKRGEREVTLRLRTVARPDADVALLLAHLGPRLPRGSRLVENVVEKTGC